MSQPALHRAARTLERTVVALAVLALAYRATLYGTLAQPPGGGYGAGEIVDYALGLLLFLLCTACAALGVALSARAGDAERAMSYRPVLVGMTTFVVYYLVHPLVPTVAPASVP